MVCTDGRPRGCENPKHCAIAQGPSGVYSTMKNLQAVDKPRRLIAQSTLLLFPIRRLAYHRLLLILYSEVPNIQPSDQGHE